MTQSSKHCASFSRIMEISRQNTPRGSVPCGDRDRNRHVRASIYSCHADPTQGRRRRHSNRHDHPISIPDYSAGRSRDFWAFIFRQRSFSIAVKPEPFGGWRWRPPLINPLSRPSVDSNCARWCPLLIAPSMRWSSAASSRDASRSRPGALYGIWAKSKHGSPRGDPHPSPARNIPMLCNGALGR